MQKRKPEKGMLEIKDSVAVITGGGSGIGFALAEYWVKNGGKVVLVPLSPGLSSTNMIEKMKEGGE